MTYIPGNGDIWFFRDVDQHKGKTIVLFKKKR